MTISSPVWCWLAGALVALVVEIVDGHPLRVVGGGLITYGLVLIVQSLVTGSDL